MSATDATLSPRLPWRDLCVHCVHRVFRFDPREHPPGLAWANLQGLHKSLALFHFICFKTNFDDPINRPNVLI